MRERLVETLNVIKADRVMNNIHDKNSTGLVLIYGETGTGKTYYTHKRTFSNGWIYTRLIAKESAKSFLKEIYRRLNKVYTGSDEVIKGHAPELERACIEIIKKLPDQVIVIDEINLATQFKKWDILEIIRDFKDIGDATIILVGEHEEMDILKAYNPHFFSRCQFLHFGRSSTADIARVIKSRSEVELSKDLYDNIISKSDGNLHKVRDAVNEIERVALEKGLSTIGLKDI